MALDQHSCKIPVEEEFFEFEVNSASIRLSFSCNPPQEVFEFEFQMPSSFHNEEIIPTPADQLFCNGKFLPCPRTLAHKTNNSTDNRYKYLLPNTATPSLVTPLQSCRQSIDEHFLDYEISDFIVNDDDWPQDSWPTNVKRHFFGQMIKASREYLKSLFRKKRLFSLVTSRRPAASKPKKVRKSKNTLITKFSCNAIKNLRLSQKEKEIHRDTMTDIRIRSLSERINWLSKTKQSSVSPTFNSASLSSPSPPSCFQSTESYDDTNMVIRNRILFISEPERSIDEAILHCKQSQMLETV
ncbi:unnamed protein product [Rhodiola kirilowii]